MTKESNEATAYVATAIFRRKRVEYYTYRVGS